MSTPTNSLDSSLLLYWRIDGAGRHEIMSFMVDELKGHSTLYSHFGRTVLNIDASIVRATALSSRL